jgi:pimeloyl-[acyl-carrier protein] methyl ester esterase
VMDICLLHGWGVNRVVWQGIENFYKAYGRVRSIDLPGYGERTKETFPTQLDLVARQIADEIPADSVVIAWSLGATIALYIQIAKLIPFRALQLISATPKFISASNWSAGQQPQSFARFLKAFEGNYLEALRGFMTLQLHGDSMNTESVENWISRLNSYPRPSQATLINGLQLLNNTDLREDLAKISLPTQIVSGKLDRICHSKASVYLHESIAGSLLSEFNCGHLPFYSCVDEYKANTKRWFELLGIIDSVNSKCV